MEDYKPIFIDKGHLNEPDWGRISIFYQWQFLRRNEDYINDFKSVELQSDFKKIKKILLKWGLMELIDPEVSSYDDIFFSDFISNEKVFFTDLGSISPNEIKKGVKFSEDILDYIGTSESEENSYLLLAFDLKSSSSKDNYKNLINYLSEKAKAYEAGVENKKPSSKLHMVERLLHIFDEINLKGKTVYQVTKELNQKKGFFHREKIDKKTVSSAYETASSYVNHQKYLRLNLSEI